MHINRLLAIPMAGALTPSILAQSVPAYDVVELGITDDASTLCPCFITNDVNDLGEAAGFFFGADGSYNAFAYRGEGPIADISPPGDNVAFARGINGLGWVVGWTDVFAPQHAFLHDGESLVDLGTLGGTYSDANDVNDAGQVVGCASTPFPEDYTHAAVWQDGSWSDLGTLGGAFSEALAINENGLIVGWAWNELWDRRAAYWNPDHSGPYELPTFSDPERITMANGVNGASVIVGQVEIEPVALPRYRAALWQNGTVTDLGLLETSDGTDAYGQPAHTSTVALDVNDAGVIVGMSYPPEASPELRFGPWVRTDGQLRNLNDLIDSDLIITDVSSISDTGIIGATARTPEDTHNRAVLLVPIAPAPGDVDGDGVVTFDDLIVLLSTWGPCLGCSADLNGDAAITFEDLLILLSNWG